MSRVIVHRNLPPLKKVLRHFSKFPEGQSHQRVMTEELRGAAETLRTTKSRPFYSMREVADFFQAPLSNVARVYKVLERDGIITRIRSSQTMLLGKKAFSRESVRGVVGVPIWMYSIAHLAYTRTFALELAEKLRRMGYVADIILYAEKADEADPDFAARLLDHRLDAVILHTPLASCRQNILTLRERGVRVFVIQKLEDPRDLPAVLYLEDYRTAQQTLAERWHKAGIRKVWLWMPTKPSRDNGEAQNFARILKNQDLDVEFVQDEPQMMLKRVSQGASSLRTAVAFLDCLHSQAICESDPHLIERISKVARLAFLYGDDQGSYLQSRIRADILEFSPIEMAARLANDIHRLAVLPDGLSHTFVPYYHEQTPLQPNVPAIKSVAG